MIYLDTSDPAFFLRFQALLTARGQQGESVAAPVRDIIQDVRARGDAALCELTERFDRVTLTPQTLRLTQEEISESAAQVPPETRAALELAAARITAFHEAQMPRDLDMTDAEGIRLGMRWIALDSAGLYVPGGKAAYPSSVLMNALPARVAGVERLAMCVPTPGGELNPLVMAAAQLCGVTEIYRIGGAQAVAAMAYGTVTIAPVDRITGPGNAYVAEAKKQVYGHTGIDSIAGPSEIVVVADSANDPALVALDLLAQAEHDELAQAVLITDDAAFAERVVATVEETLAILSRREIARRSWEDYGAVVVVRDWGEASEIVNALAPEHLEVMLDDPRAFSAGVRHAGAIFMGRHCPEALGDYVGGPNHVLPTSRTARFSSGLSVFDFLKRTTTIETDAAGLLAIGPAGAELARAEGLEAHGLSLSERIRRLTEKGSE
ncbi:histidinol dehydrogenase [Oecophyllibacter saccharovorans]|uniref:Histidinol dehydrogenase n=1 Tax=Oecophyllibacter saccharovorans TaxID=2558360 RepID=A0A506UKQ7_9PROT|nr:histidinol dehydrogenase [Oecophyllibacter saccharovorans]TPW33944.1 histidinol dehydrogenase [Oecophyllibacter saccharovorans]